MAVRKKDHIESRQNQKTLKRSFYLYRNTFLISTLSYLEFISKIYVIAKGVLSQHIY